MNRILCLVILILLTNQLFAVIDHETDVADVSQIGEAGYKQRIVDSVSNFFPPEITILIISTLPIVELRGAIPIGINYFGMNPLLVFILSIIGNMFPIFFILLFFDLVTKVMYRIKFTRILLEKLFERTRKKTALVEKYEELGLIFFVAIPLPITGAWTGSLVAYLLGLRFWRSILFIFLGVLIAGVIVTSLSLLGWVGAFIAMFSLLVFIFRRAYQLSKKNKQKDRGR